MSGAVTAAEALAQLRPEPGLVVLMCGLAGSGKTTFAQQLEAQGFTRLSIDEIVWETAGRYGVDYAPEDYPQRLDAARETMRARVGALLQAGAPAVVDSAFWSRRARDEYKALVEAHGGTWRIVFMAADRATLSARLRTRSRRFDANAAFEVTEERLDQFMRSFEAPDGEDEIVVGG
ncbi:MAG TPA: ATP-binding protein [Caulobacteraceae bacterium]|nr:ATP-binding protein [Caulobacteraceae bacterium]